MLPRNRPLRTWLNDEAEYFLVREVTPFKSVERTVQEFISSVRTYWMTNRKTLVQKEAIPDADPLTIRILMRLFE